ncbi:LamG-like jellyroll fold domain-containing protein [Aestuariibaculum suncheonense]|uniref:Fibronectin type III domain-containing protein n=1 Tax=Aestuariibaculum suncheonense TaxID=1028745 RepID=A0A8J6Q616_9FLAO|nr:LamG-like jellyroll fold domain-containing protein [Aestuariibaculum suncheonense]MBD0834844.1 fibronectin type III domain-containing protein [Aestuariibaculum suncheonense]
MLKKYLLLIVCFQLFPSVFLAQSPLNVFTEENYGGNTQSYEIFTIYKDLGTFDNNIKSFKLRQGYMATFATSSDGTGYSRVFRADDSDLEVATMPAYLQGTVSFIRVMALNDFVTKKGWAGWVADEVSAVNATWRYDWSAGGAGNATLEYVPIKQNLNWPSFGEIESKPNVTHVLGYNEPDRPDQSNISLETVIANWKYYMQSGLRLGAPAYSDPYNGLWGFMGEAEANNLRVDFIPIHSYWSRDQQDWSWRLDDVWNAFHRPIWITEWNNGANWTNEAWPSGNRLATDANVQKQLTDITYILNILESKPYVERYSIYNWVEDCRAMILIINDCWKSNNPDWQNYEWLKTAPVISTWVDDCGENTKVLTPAGVYYRDHASAKAFNPSSEYVPTWNPLKENLTFTVSEDFQSVTINWDGNNGELVNKYIVQRKSGFSWVTIYESTDYTILKTTPQPMPAQTTEYRIRVIGKDNTETSQNTFFTVKSIAEAPDDLSGQAISAKKISLNWSAVTNADAYNIKRSATSGGSFETVAAYVTDLSYLDTGLEPETTYYYKISSFNTGGESPDSSPEIMIKTMTLTAPDEITNVLVGSGDAQVKMKWDVIEDSQYEILRSESQVGPFESVVITNFEVPEYTDLTVVNGTTYYYKVRAFNEAGQTPDSEVMISTPNLGQHTYFNFNENSGTNPFDQWGIHSANLLATAGWNDGKEGSGILLNGSSSSYVDIEDGIIQDLTDFTISVWVQLGAASNWSRIFDFGTGSNVNMFLTPQNGGTGTYRFAIKNGGAEEQINTSVSPVVGAWTHVAITMEGSLGIMYIDGVEVGRKEDFSLNPSSLGHTTQNYIGKSQYPDPYLNATVDEFRIYNRALNPSEVESLKSKTLHVDYENLKSLGVYKFYTSNQSLFALNSSRVNANYQLYSISGQLLSQGKMNVNETVNLGYYRVGIYIVKVIDSLGEVSTVKVLVK